MLNSSKRVWYFAQKWVWYFSEIFGPCLITCIVETAKNGLKLSICFVFKDQSSSLDNDFSNNKELTTFECYLISIAKL